jgi:regulator of RNase E activity RraA
MTADADLLEQYLALDTATVSDALDGCGLPPGQGGLRPMWGKPRIAGFAVTVELEPLTGRHDGAHILTDAIASAGADDIMVVANGGRIDVSSWGGIVSAGAAMRSVRGVVTDGACRDVEQARDLGFPVFARAQVPVTARGRLRQRSTGAPIRLGQVTVSPGDVVMADEGGVVVIPRARAAEVLTAARGVRAREEQIGREVRAGLPLPQAMRDARLAGTRGAMTGSVTAGHEHDVLSRLRTLPTAAISDALDREGIPGAVQGLAPLSDGFRAAGPAFTVRYAPADASGGTVGDFLDEVPPGAVIVIGNDGRRDVTVWGGIMTEVASARGVAGTVIDGVCRDVPASLSHGYPLFSRGRFMRTGKDRVRLVSVGEPLTISGVGIRPGTIVCADADGVVAVPEGSAERVADVAGRIEQVERQIVAAVRAGDTLRQARVTFGYHDLQRGRS